MQWTLSIMNTLGTIQKCSDYGGVHYNENVCEMLYICYYVISLDSKEYLAWLAIVVLNAPSIYNVKVNLVFSVLHHLSL